MYFSIPMYMFYEEIKIYINRLDFRYLLPRRTINIFLELFSQRNTVYLLTMVYKGVIKIRKQTIFNWGFEIDSILTLNILIP